MCWGEVVLIIFRFNIPDLILLLKVWSTDQKHQHSLEVCLKDRLSDPTPILLSQIPKSYIYIYKFEKHYSIIHMNIQ